jgi:hypothetical protein
LQKSIGEKQADSFRLLIVVGCHGAFVEHERVMAFCEREENQRKEREAEEVQAKIEADREARGSLRRRRSYWSNGGCGERRKDI